MAKPIPWWMYFMLFGVCVSCDVTNVPPPPDRVPYHCYFWIEDKACADALDDEHYEETIRRCSTDVLFDIRIPAEGDVRPHVHLDDAYHCAQGVAWTDNEEAPKPRTLFTVSCEYPIWGMICWEDEDSNLAFPERARNCGYAGTKARKECRIKHPGSIKACQAEADKARERCIADWENPD